MLQGGVPDPHGLRHRLQLPRPTCSTSGSTRGSRHERTIQDPSLAAERPGRADAAQARRLPASACCVSARPRPIGLGVIVFFVVLAVFAPLHLARTARPPRSAPCYAARRPSQHWLGCDDGGIDMLSELMQGGRISLVVGFAATLVAMVIGGGVGILSGYFGGWIDIGLMRVTDYLLVIPDLVFAMVIADLWGPSLFHVIIVIGILVWTSTARVIRAQVMSREGTRLRQARAGARRPATRGSSASTSCRRSGPLLIANTVLTVAIAIYLETALAFLGLGDPTVITWGTILEHAFDRTAISSGAWWAIVPDGFVHRAGHRRLLPVRAGDRGRAEPAAEGRAPVAHAAGGSARWPAEGPGARYEQPAGGRGPARLVRARRRPTPVHAVQGVSFALDPGERFGLVGESGCGKTTTILALMGLLPPNASLAGEVRIDGTNILAGGEDSVRQLPLERHRDGVPGRDERAQPGEEGRLADRRADGVPRRRAGQGGPAAGRRAAGAGRHPGRGRPSATRTSSPAACASARRSRWRWPASRRSCSPTSRRPRWT